MPAARHHGAGFDPGARITFDLVVADIERVATRAARAAGRIHLKWLSRTSISRKSNPIDLVTEADREAEQAVIDIIRRAFPAHAILAEETGADHHRSDHRWIIDPLDGTTNFAHGFPQFCVSIAYERRGRILVGVVYDPTRNELFAARRRGGARLNGKRIRVSATPTLSASLVATGFPYDRRERRRFYLTFYEAFMLRTQGVRRAGSAALDLCYVGCGRFDAYWEYGLKPWDVAAGSLIVEEAGGTVTNIDGAPFDADAGQIVASNGRLHEAMLKALAETIPEAHRRQAELEERRT